MTSILHRSCNQPRMSFHAQASRIMGAIDLSSGAGVTCLGHSCDAIKVAMIEQIKSMPYVHSTNWTTRAVEALGELLTYKARFVGGGTTFLSTGAEAVEGACKIAMQYFKEIGNGQVAQFCARKYSYHGNTLFTLALGDHPRKQDFYNTVSRIGYDVTRFDAFAPTWDRPDDIQAYHQSSLCRLDETLKESQVLREPMIVVVEPIAGMALGIEPGTSQYLADLRELCDAAGALLIYDEVLCGNFRTGHAFAWQWFQEHSDRNLAPDIIAVGKGITGGYFPLSAVIVNQKVRNAIRAGSHRLWHSTTNQNHAIGCAAGLAAINVYESSEMIAAWHQTSRDLVDGLAKFVGATIGVECVVGQGTLYGLRLDRNVSGLHAVIRERCLAAGVAIYTDGATVDGLGNFILIAPPHNITPEELTRGLEILSEVIMQVANEWGAEAVAS